MATKSAIRGLFQAIRHGDLAAVKAAIAADRALLNACAISPPKKDDGQSLLHVAIKTNHGDIANYLMDAGIDVTFMETSTVNEWRTPVLHDTIRAAIMCSGFADIVRPEHAHPRTRAGARGGCERRGLLRQHTPRSSGATN